MRLRRRERGLGVERRYNQRVEERIVVSSSEVAGAKRGIGTGLQLFQLLLSLAALALALLFLPLFGFTFYYFASFLSQLRGGRGELSATIPLLLATVASWSVVYLAHDSVGAMFNARAERITLDRARLLLGELPKERHFVELRVPGAADLGWLFVEANRLRFVGELVQAEIPRAALRPVVKRSATLGGLLSAFVTVKLSERGWLRILPRENIRHLSDARKLAPALAERLVRWLDAPPAV